MNTVRRRGATALTAAIALSLAAVPAVMVASGAPAEDSSVLQSGAAVANDGWLAIETGADDRVQWAAADGTVKDTQSLSEGRKCLLSTDGSLLAFTGQAPGTTGNVASFSSDSLGVAEKKSGTSCAQVGLPGEVLTLALNPAVKGTLGPLVASSAYLDVELKQSAQILATATLGGKVTGRYELRSGATIGAPVDTGFPDATLVECNNPADSGPDSGPRDNCRWPISGPSWIGEDDANFDTLELTVLNGSFALEGGGDGVVEPLPPASLPQGASLIELVEDYDGILDCNAATVLRDSSGETPQVQVRRLNNADDATCSEIPYTLRNYPDSARFLKPTDSQTTAQFVADFVWTADFSATSTSLNPTYVDFETPTAGTKVTLGWCPDPVYDGTVTIGGVTVPKLVGIASPLTQDDKDEADGVQFACVGVQSAAVTTGAPNQVKIVEQVYILGDIFLRKP